MYCTVVMFCILLVIWFVVRKRRKSKRAKKAKVNGYVAPGFEPVKEMFEKNFEADLESEAQCCAYVGEEKVVDLWASAENDPSYTDSSLTMVFSASKAVSAIVFATLVDKGLVKYTDKISDHWPEFGQNGKEEVTVEDVMKHEAGLNYIRMELTEESTLPEGIKRNDIGKCIEDAEQKFPPEEFGTNRNFHAVTQGYIQNEIFRRIDPEGRTMGEALREDVAEPLGAEVHFGLDQEEMARVAKVKAWGRAYILFHMAWPRKLGSKIQKGAYGYSKSIKKMRKISKNQAKSIFFPWTRGEKFHLSDFDVWNDQQTLKSEMTSMNGACSAKGLAKLAAVMANKGRLGDYVLLKEDTWEEIHGGISTKNDVALDIPGVNPTSITRGGLPVHRMIESEPGFIQERQKMCEGFYGYNGLGGSAVMWNPEEKVGFAYVPTLMAWYDFHHLKSRNLQAKVVECSRQRRSERRDYHTFDNQ